MDFDVVIAGAGPGGCLAARDFARAGLSVGLFDSDERESLGKTIIVEAERTVFDTVGVRPPAGDDVPYHQERIRIFSSRGKECFSIVGEHPSTSLYLDRLAKQLLREAEDAGARFFGGHTAVEPVLNGSRVCGARFRSGDRTEEANARLTVDATGFSAALVRKLDPDAGIGFRDSKADLVIADNRFHEIDASRAQAAIRNGLHLDNEVWSRLAAHGNYSTKYSYLSLAAQRAYILVGLKADYDQPPLEKIVGDFRDEQGYYGRELCGGSGPIRVRRSLDGLVADGFMVIGEAACQVIPAHGSGVASSLYAGHLAAKVACEALESDQPAEAALWPYAYEYQSSRGAVLATYDANKLMLEKMTRDQVADLLESGAMQPEDLYNTAVPRPVSMSLRTVPARALGLMKKPGLIGRVVKIGRAIAPVREHYAAYPKTYDPADFSAWKQKTRSIFEPLEQAEGDN